MLIINDEEFVEGIIGAVGWIIAVFYIRNGLYKHVIVKKSNMAIIGGLSWTILWFIRKIGLNFYRNIKKQYDMPDRHLNLPSEQIKHMIIFILINLLVLYLFVFRYTKKSNKHLFSLSYYEIPLVLIVFIFGITIFNSKS
jgi:hypothetical protein